MTFVGESVETIKAKQYYTEVRIKGELYNVGDCVAVASEDRPEVKDIGRVEYIWKDSRGDGHIHVHWFT